jgi:cell division septum initiation protein DivIVA
MSDVVSFNKDEWEAFLRDSEELINRYNALLKRVADLEESKVELEQRLQLAQEQLREAQEMKRAVDAEKEQELIYGRENIRRLHSEVSRMLETEVPEQGVVGEVEVTMVENARKAEPKAQTGSKSVEDVLKQRRDAVRRLLSDSEET